MAKDFEPGSMGCHEALHMAAFLQNAVYEELCLHQAIKKNAKWKRMANKVSDDLGRLYQAIGQKHMNSDDQ